MNPQESLELLRAQFPNWAFRWHEVEPSWHTRRKGDYAARPVVITDLRGTDPHEPALALLRIPAVEPVEEPDRRSRNE
ncbi:hypothetical protein D0T12_33175 [Actinomadura spongiicola]|uniref:Uncharacterized protein n=1 Tax=Actinomadura spongiicola TaxID=2303421 RepID=A0A372G785_9ACTN|nr:hypothetical protein [Actinomadura spongiicola]RFS81226.1 hypothetical protein D0T12_33175 [Actinomadura spongiicola]